MRVVLDGVLLETPFLDITSEVKQSSEGGLLGLAFHPGYEVNGRFFVMYTRDGEAGYSLISVLEEYEVSTDPNVADGGSATTILEVGQPNGRHNGGWIGFGPNDDKLYVAFGDGGLDDGPELAQDTSNLLGSILRLDVDGAAPYGIPIGNPFVGGSGADEIWAYGVRNPYRCGFDRHTGALYVADVGEETLEEINVIPAGAGGRNLGWGCMEASMCAPQTFCTCNDPSLTLPILEYDHFTGCAVIGGSVYRGCMMPELSGTYFFADFCARKVWSFRYIGGAVTELLDRTPELDPDDELGSIVGFGTDARGELYLCGINGDVHRIEPVGGGTCTYAPQDFDENGVIDFQDLLVVLASWGPCVACPADLDGDGIVGFADLLEVISNWTM